MKYMENKIKEITVKTVIVILGKALQEASKVDPDIKEELKAFPDGFTIAMRVLPIGPKMGLKKEGDRLYYLGSNVDPDQAQLVVNFKNLQAAFLVFTAQMGTVEGFVQHRLNVKGDLSNAMIFTRCVNIVQRYLFPAVINKMILKKLPPMPLKKHLLRFVIYGSLPLGK